MLLTRASEYALLALINIAEVHEPLGADKLSMQLGISKSFLAKVLQGLAREGILISFKGVKGGFSLARKENTISLLDIMHAAEGKNPTVFDCAPSVEDCPSDVAKNCKVWPFLNNLQCKVDSFFEGLTLADIMQKS